MKAFARVDGAALALLWTVSFACYIVGISHPVYATVSIILALMTPFFVARRLRVFRNEALGGVISFLRAFAFSMLIFFYASVLFALVQYVYMAYIDHGYLLQTVTRIFESPEGRQLLEGYGLTGKEMADSLQSLAEMRPIDFALNVLTGNLTIGLLVGVPLAGLLKSRMATGDIDNQNRTK